MICQIQKPFVQRFDCCTGIMPSYAIRARRLMIVFQESFTNQIEVVDEALIEEEQLCIKQ